MKRYVELDSIRGIAALAVFIGHMPLSGLSVPTIVDKFLKITGITNGHGAVMIFFCLSGFVLSIPILSKNEVNYFPFLIKRFFRIYIPYLISIIFAIILSQIFLFDKLDNLGGISGWWNSSLTPKLIIEHLYLIGNIHSDAFNGVIWSLIHELRISLIFPFVVLFIKSLNWKISIFTCLILSCLSGLNNVLHFQYSSGYMITYFDTLHYLSIFIIGSLIAKYRFSIVSFLTGKHFIVKFSLLIGSVIMLNCSAKAILIIYNLTGVEALSSFIVILQEYGMSIGAIGIMILAMSSLKMKKVLLVNPIPFIGKISFSLYLYHPLVLLTCLHVLYGTAPLWFICLFSILVAILLSYVFYIIFEKPSMTLGRKLANKLIMAQAKQSKIPQQFVK